MALIFIILVAMSICESSARATPISSSAFNHSQDVPGVKIIGGESVPIEDYPYQVCISRWENFYGGAIISANFVITAAHCVSGHPKQSISIRAGSSDRLSGGSLHTIAEVIIHENFKSQLDYDIALIRVNEPFEFDQSRQPVKLFDQREPLDPGALANMSGWGVSENNRSTKLRAIQVPLVDRETCNIIYNEFGGLADGEFCAGYYNQEAKGPCYNDDGGPLVVEGRLIGVMSYVFYDCIPPNYPAVYSEIAYFRDWIDKHAGFLN